MLSVDIVNGLLCFDADEQAFISTLFPDSAPVHVDESEAIFCYNSLRIESDFRAIVLNGELKDELSYGVMDDLARKTVTIVTDVQQLFESEDAELLDALIASPSIPIDASFVTVITRAVPEGVQGLRSGMVLPFVPIMRLEGSFIIEGKAFFTIQPKAF